jgi:GAF domain-containing protein
MTDARLRATLRAVAVRAAAAARLDPPAGEAVLRSIVEAPAALFDAEAASLALYDAAADRLVFRVAAGPRGDGVVGLAIDPSEGVAGYVYSTGQPIAIADTSRDARFSGRVAAATSYVPRSLVAVPLLDDDGVLGVLEVLDKRGDGGFTLRDLELASVFARQATVAIRATRLERDAASLLRAALVAAAGVPPAGGGALTERGSDAAAGEPAAPTDEAVDALVSDTLASLGDEGGIWDLADRIARLRAVDPAELEVVRDVLDALLRRAERRPGRGRSTR